MSLAVHSSLLAVSAFALTVWLSACSAKIVPAAPAPRALAVSVPETTIAVPQRLEDGLPQAAVENFNARHTDYAARRGDLDLLFLGDSITEGWAGAKDVWDRYYGTLKADQFGVGYDRTQHLLWRLQNGEGQHVSPRVVVLLIGTNNIGQNPDDDVVAGITAVVKEIQSDFRSAKILLLGILPRNHVSQPDRAHITAVNRAISKLDDGKRVFFLDIGAKFLDPDGEIPTELMADLLHPTEKGYETWAQGIKDKLASLGVGAVPSGPPSARIAIAVRF